MKRLLAILMLMILPTLAHAHAVGVECKLKDGKVEVEAFYDDDSPAIKAKIEVVNAKDQIIATGVTDGKGRWSFAAPDAGKYDVRVDAGAGHRTNIMITIRADAKGAVLDTGGSKGSTNPPPGNVVISDGRSREEFTGTPWVKIALGLTTIAGLAGVALVAFAMRKNQAVIRVEQPDRLSDLPTFPGTNS